MTDTTDIKALRDVKRYGTKATGNEHFKYVTAEMTDGPWVKQEDYFALLTLLEAERQRADDAHKYGSERDAENESLMLTVGRLRVEIAELKGEQVPIAWLNDAHLARGHIEGEAGEEDAGPGMIPVYREKFTAPQKPVVLPGKITRGFVELAEMYGCEPAQAQFIAVGWNAAIEAAGGIVKVTDKCHPSLMESVTVPHNVIGTYEDASGGRSDIVTLSDKREMKDMSSIVKDGE